MMPWGRTPSPASRIRRTPKYNDEQRNDAAVHIVSETISVAEVHAMRKWPLIGFMVVFLAVPALAAAGTVQLPQTGQKSCWNGLEAKISCAGSGQDGELRAGVPWPNPRFTSSDSGATMTDSLTGLIWLKDTTVAAGTCGSLSTARTWQGALDYVKCLNTSGTNGYLLHNDWRLPNVLELESLVNAETTDNVPWLASQGFTLVNDTYLSFWSSTTSAYWSPSSAFILSIHSKDVFETDKYNYNNIWPVRGGTGGVIQLRRTGQQGCWNAGGTSVTCSGTGQDGSTQLGVAWPDPRFTDHGNGTVTDNLTGLMWSQNAGTPDPAACRPDILDGLDGYLQWDGISAYYRCLNENAFLGYRDWRMPNRQEFLSLVHYGLTYPTYEAGSRTWLAAQGFSGVEQEYPSSTTLNSAYYDPQSGRSGYAFYLHLGIQDGRMDQSSKYGTYRTWPVRGGLVNLAGDVDGSGGVGLSDAVAALKILAGLAPATVRMSGDLNEDGKIGVQDAILLLQRIAGLR
jgi:hypothetical protein